MSQQPVSDADLIEHAAEWMARTLADDFSVQDQHALLHWRMTDARHEAVWQKLQQVSATFNSLPASVNSRALVRQQPVGRRQLLQWLGIGGALASAGWYSADQRLVQRYCADFRTAVGEIRRVILQDGSQLDLNTNTAIDVHFTAQQRKLVLQAGEIFLATAHEHPRRPLFVDTRFGRVTALGTQFIVRQLDNRVRVQVKEGVVEVQPNKGGMSHRIVAGQQLEFTANTINPVKQIAIDTSWREGFLVAEHMRLMDFVAEISRYRPGILLCDERLTELQISGVFSLRDSDRALASVAASLPIAVQYRSRYWAKLIPITNEFR